MRGIVDIPNTCVLVRDESERACTFLGWKCKQILLKVVE